MLKIAIVGSPNVGKSTLFNRLVGKNDALISSKAGTTRDVREGLGKIGDIEFILYDMAGVETIKKDELTNQINTKIEEIIFLSDTIMLVFDSKLGITSEDVIFSRKLKKLKKNIILLGNKSEGKENTLNFMEGWNLGIGEPISISSAHGLGLNNLYEALKPFIKIHSNNKFKNYNNEEENKATLLMKVTIVGRPNTGKSTLVNNILGFDRMLTGSESGITHDAIEIPFEWKGKSFSLIDTAGMRRKSKVFEEVEYKIVGDTLKAIKFTNVAVLLIDGRDEINKQDLAIARWVVEEGRALIICINMWDLVKDHNFVFTRLLSRLERSLPQIKGVPVLKISGLLGNGIDELMNQLQYVYKLWNKRISTGKLNTWFENIKDIHPPPIVKGKRIKLLYIVQVKARPPNFVIFANQPSYLPDSYLRYLTSKLREEFNLYGIPIRINTRKKSNPYVS